ncbi:MAG: hypothetical protein ABI528_07980 [bacterium]
MSQPTDQENKDNNRIPDSEFPTPEEGKNKPKSPEIESIRNTEFPEKEKNFEGEKRNDDHHQETKGELPKIGLHEDGEIKEHTVSEKAMREEAGEAMSGNEPVIIPKRIDTHKTSYDVVGKSIKNPTENPITPDNQ